MFLILMNGKDKKISPNFQSPNHYSKLVIACSNKIMILSYLSEELNEFNILQAT